METCHAVAEISYSRTCFGFKPKHKPTVDVLDEAAAAARVQQGEAAAVLWLDVASESVFLTERWDPDDPVSRPVPLNVCVARQEAVCHAGQQEVAVATLTFTDRASAELHGKLALSALPEWLFIRRRTATRSLLVLTDHWIVTEEEQALKLQHPEGQLDVLLRLNLQHGSIEAELVQDGQAHKSFLVSCFGDVVKLLKKHSRPKQRLDKTVHTVLQELRPTSSSVGRLLARLEAAVMGHKGAPSMAQWCRGGVMAALVDSAASLGTDSALGDSRVSKTSHRHSSSGHSDTPSSQPRHRGASMPGGPPAGQQQSGSSTACLATLQALAECCCVVLQTAASGEAQAVLLPACVRRALMGSMSEAVCVLQLLRMVLRHIGASSTSAACMQLRQACCDKQLLHQMQHCYSMAAPLEEQQLQAHKRQQPVECGIGPSHQLEGLSPDGASEPSTPQGSVYALPAAVSKYEQVQQAGSAADGATEETPTPTPRSPAAFFSRRQSLVPKLHLPVPITPAPNSASRLSVQSSARAAVRDSVSAAATPGGREAAAPSFVRALQQLGHSCGQSVMAADLAAFVTHKQLLGGVVAVEAALQHSRPAGGSAQSGGGDCSVPGSSKLSFEQLTRLALPAQLQLELLEVLVMLAEAPGSDLMLPKQWEHLLFSSLLVSKPMWLLHGGTVSGVIAGRESVLSEHAHARTRALNLQLIACSSGMWHACVSSQSQTAAGNSQLQPLGSAALHNTVLAQFLQKLVSCSSQHDSAGDAQRTHVDCAELLLLLRDYLRASQQPQLADTACRMLGGVLGQQEHLLRSTRLEHWSVEAVVHMDALVQLYTQLLGQVTSPQAVDWLLVQLGVQAGGSRPGPCSAATASPHTPSSVPADTLQLVLDFLQTHLAKMAVAADSTAAGATPVAAALMLSPALSSGRSSNSSRGLFAAAADSATSTAGLSVPLLAALQQRNSTPGGANVFVLQLKANCWLLLTRVLLLAACQPAVRPPDPLSSPLCSRELSSSRRGSTQHTLEGGGNTTPGPPGFASTPKGRMQASLSARGVAAVAPQPPDHPAVSPSPSRRPSLPLLSLPNSASRTPSAAMLTAAGYGSDPPSCMGTPQGQVSAQGRAVSSAAGRCSIWQVLVELLMVNSSMGQATVLQHMAETRGIRLALPLQHAVADFLSAALGTPDSYAFSKPQLAEFYVHHHFLHFTQSYHKLSAGPSTGAATLCKSHLQVLLALCRQTGGAHQVRRRFLQLKVLEFLAREASLEYMCRHNQLAASPSSSCCSTPLSTSRTAASRRTSARGATDPGWAGGAAAAAGASPAAALLLGPGDPPGLSLTALGGSGAGGTSYRECSVARSARGVSGSRLWGSSPGCQPGARPAGHNSQGSSRAKAVSAGGAAEGLARSRQQFGCSAGAGAPTPSQQQQQGLKLGSKVKAAVEALESAAAAVRPQLQPTPPRSGAPSAAAGRRQPGHQRLVSTMQPAAAGPQVPKLKLSHLGGPSTADAAAAPGSGRSPKGSPIQSRVAWQVLEPTAEEEPAAAGQTAALGGGQARSSSSSDSSSAGSPPASPRADILGYEVPASVRSQRRVKQPQLTGDASMDNIIIDNWERETGLDFQFDGLSDNDDEGDSSSGGSDNDDSESSSDGGGSECRHTARQPAVSRLNLRPQTPEVAFLSAAAPDKPWPALQLDLGGGPRSGRWISSSDTVEEATAAQMAQIVGRECLGVGGSTGTVWADSSDSSTLVAAAAGGGTAAAGSNQGGCKPQIPRLPVGGLQGPAAPAAAVARVSSTGAAAGALPAAASVHPPESPGTYRPGFDLEEDFERLMAAGEWEDSDTCSTGAATARSQTPRSPQRHWQPATALQQQQSPPARQQAVPRLPPFKSQHQQQPGVDASSCEQRREPSGPAQSSASPDVQAHADVHTPKPKRHGSKKQAVLAGSGRRVLVGPQAHALADMSGSSSSSDDEGRAYGSDSDLDSDNSDAEAAGLLCRTSPSRPHAVVIPRLNLPQLAQPSWHLPTADLALTTGRSSDTGLSRSSYRTSITSASRGGGGNNGPVSLTIMPLTTSRMMSGAAAADSSRGGFNSSSHATPGGPHGPSSFRPVGAGLVGSGGPDMLSGGDAELQLGTPSVYGAAGGAGDPSPQGAYAAHRRKCAVYMDLELHMLCIELALHLLVTPSGQLDPVQLPHEPSDISLQRKVLLLLEHLSHPANLDMTCAMAQRASSILQEQRRRQSPLPLCSNGLQPTVQQQLACSQLGAAGPAVAASGLSQDSSSETPAKQRQLQEACRAVWDDGSPAHPPAGSGRGPVSSAGCAAAADAAAGLAASSLRLLKLLCLPVLDVSSLVVGGMINKGAFSEVMAGTYRSPDGSPPMPVALKVIDCSEDDACSFERVYNEVASLESLRGQPCVVPLLEYGVTSSISGVRQWVLVFPRYQGSLREWRLNWAGRGLNTEELPVYLSLFLQVARAVAVLHASNVVHFDIKGDNVLLQQGFTPAGLDPSSSRNSGSGIVLADFGDALMLENAHASSQRHRGTELFSSPEMLLLHAGRQHAQHEQHDRRKHRGVHAAHDVWSLGCTLYELLTGSVLFEDEGVGRITSYSSSQSSGGGAHCLRPDARGWGVLNAREKSALQQHSGCIELVESMLVGEPNWRPTAEQVVVKTQRLLASLCGGPPSRG